MKENWPISLSVFIAEPMEERMRDLQANDVRYMELTAGELRFYENYRENSRRIFKTAAEHNVDIRTVHLPFAPFEYIDPASTDATVRGNFLREQSELLKISAECGASVIVVHPSGEPYLDGNRPEHLKYAIESMDALNKVAQDCGVKLAVENLPRTCMCRDCHDIEAIANALPDIFFCFDSNHSLKDDNVNIIRSMGNRIVNLHISDYDFVDERHRFPFDGLNDWPAIIAALREVNYSGTWNYEIGGSGELPVSRFIDNYKRLFC